MKQLELSGMPNRRALLAEARRLGFQVTFGNGGEVRIISPFGRVNMNNRRKEGSEALRRLIRLGQAAEVKR